MSATELPQPLLSVNLGEQIGSMQWTDYESALAWLSGQQSEWDWVSLNGQYNFQGTSDKIKELFTNAISGLNTAKDYHLRNNEVESRNYLSSAKDYLESSIKQFPWLVDSAQRNYINDLCKSGKPEIAAATVTFWLKLNLSSTPIEFVIQAISKWQLHELGVKDRFEPENTLLKKLAGDMQSALTAINDAAIKQTSQFDTLSLSLSEQSADQQNKFNEDQGGRESDWKQQLEIANTSLQNLQNTYDKHMALAAPVEYWELKRKKHRNWVIGIFILLVISIFMSGWLMHNELQSIGKAFEQAQSSKGISTASLPVKSDPSSIASIVQTAATFKLGTFILFATLCFWMLRLIVRIFLSNIHLENDAAERVVMAKTYLSLIRDGNLPKDESINTVLAALFRPSGDGIVKDEGIPPTILEFLTKSGK
ncbi:DUF6161 domain-containing protein [Undibacterium sp. Ji49W]|uniref:DUF6161 domain-containing protein n=1 Tax=Undibacterium sp. Ji49W TaxID=3413040 RepID=UPI003BF30F66